MGSLSNLYISQSYQSLIHLATNNTASATLIGLEDGLGNPIGVSVNTAGNLYLSGTFSASLQEGYLYVGNSSGRTIAFPTSSLVTNINTGSLVTTSSFNAYTASTNIRLSNIELTTASVLVSISNLNSFTQSQQSINSILAGEIDNLEAKTGSYATTGSNNFIGNQTITGNITAFSASFTYLQTLFETASVIYSSGSNQFGDELTDTQTLSGSVKVQGSLTVNGVPVQTSSFDPSALNQATASLQAFTASANIRLNNLESTSASVNTSINALNTFTASQSTASLVTSINNLNTFSASALVSISNLNTTTASLNTSASLGLTTASLSGQILTFTKGNNSTFAITIPDVSGSDISALNQATASLQSFTASAAISITNLNQSTASQQVSIDALNTFTASQSTASIVTSINNLNTFSASALVSISNINSTTASLNTSVTQLNASSASQQVSIDALNVFTASQSTASLVTSINNLNTFSASALTSLSNLNTTTQSLNTSVTNINQATASLFTSASLALVTASFDNGTRNLTFTKGDTQTFSVNIPDISGSAGNFVTTASFNSYTQSNDQRVTSLESNSASVNTSITNINLFTQSADQRLDSIEAQSGSWVTSAITGSSIITASVTDDDITFTKGDGSQFTIQVATGSFAISASYAETASLAINAKDIVVDVKNTTGGTLTKGTVVRIIGATGDNALIGTASWEDDNNSANTLGFVVTDIPNDGFGRVMTQGTLLSVNTDPTLGYAAGDLVYLSSSGQFTKVIPPAPYHEVRLGQVLRAQQNNGSIYVLIQNGYELSELHDVDINTGSLATNNLLAYNSASGQWENKTLTQVGGLTTASFNTATGSFVVTGSVAGNVLTFTKGDNTTFNLTVATGSGGGGSTDTGSLLVTASFASTNITFTKGDASQFSLDGFATTGSNTFRGNQTLISSSISLQGSGQLIFPNGFNIEGNASSITQLSSATSIQFITEPPAGPGGTNDIKFINRVTGSSIEFINQQSGAGNTIVFEGGDVLFKVSQVSGSTGKVRFGNSPSNSPVGIDASNSTFTASLQQGYAWVGDFQNISRAVPTSSFTGSGGGGTTYINPTLNPFSGSLILVANTFTSSSFAHISASANGQVNLVFKNNNNTATTVISGSGNIFTNTGNPTTGFRRYLTSGNISLAGALPQISASMQFSPTISNNTFLNTTATGNPITIRGPISSSAYSITGNYINNALNIGSSAANNAEKIVAGLSVGNSIIQTLSIVANKTNTTQGSSILNNQFQGTSTLNMNSSSIDVNNNLWYGTNTITNNSSGSSRVSVFGNAVGLYQNIMLGGNTVTFSGSNDPNDVQDLDYNGGVFRSMIIGTNTPFVLTGPTGSNSISNTGIIGNGLIVTGSSGNPLFSGITTGHGSLFTGRFNAEGTKNRSAENVFVVGTGTSTSARKTGFLIDSGSNTFIEGTLNVSGASSLNGNTIVTGSLTLSSSAAIELDVIGNSQFTGSLTVSGSTTVTGSVNISNVIQLAQLDPLPAGATGQLAVSQSLLWFYDATQWKQVSLV